MYLFIRETRVKNIKMPVVEHGLTMPYHFIFTKYRISSYSSHGNYSVLNLEIVANSNSCRNILISYLIN